MQYAAIFNLKKNKQKAGFYTTPKINGQISISFQYFFD